MLYEAEHGDIAIAVVGDAMLSRRLRAFREPPFLKLVELIRDTDVSLANLEFLFHDYEHSWQWTHGTYTRSAPRNLAELKWMGFDGVFTANNHAYDFSEGGFLTTLEHLDRMDMPHAGGGTDLDHARAPAYIDAPRGRPLLAEDQVAHDILTWLQTMSAPFGTEIRIDGTVGSIRL